MEELKVVAVKKNDEGNLSKFKLSDGRVVNFDECAAMCDCGELNLIHTSGKDGRRLFGHTLTVTSLTTYPICLSSTKDKAGTSPLHKEDVL